MRLPLQEVEDLTQRVLLHTLAQPHRFRGASSLNYYVFSVARKALADRHRLFLAQPRRPALENHEIAVELGINYNTVRSRLVRALDGVREQLELGSCQLARLG